MKRNSKQRRLSALARLADDLKAMEKFPQHYSPDFFRLRKLRIEKEIITLHKRTAGEIK